MFQLRRGAYRFALSGLCPGAVFSTQGGAAFCPGLTCSGPFGAEHIVSPLRGGASGWVAHLTASLMRWATRPAAPQHKSLLNKAFVL